MERVFHNAFDAGGAGDCVAKQHGRVGKIDCGNMLRSVSTINERIRRLMRIYKVDNMRSLIAMMNLLQLV